MKFLFLCIKMNKIIRCLGLCKEKGCNYYVNMFSKKRNLNKLDIV